MWDPFFMALTENQRVYIDNPKSPYHGKHGEVTDPNVSNNTAAMVLLDGERSDMKFMQTAIKPESVSTGAPTPSKDLYPGKDLLP